MPGGVGQPASGTWTQWPLAKADPGRMLTMSASRHQAGQAELATQMKSSGRTRRDRFQRGTEARRSTSHPSYLAGHPDPVRLQRPLRRLIRIQDGTAPGGSDSLADPTWPNDRSADGVSLSQLALWFGGGRRADRRWFGVGARRARVLRSRRVGGCGSIRKNAYQWAD